MMIGSRTRWLGLLVFGVITLGNTSSFGQLPNDTWSPIHHFGRMQGIGWGDGYHSCSTTQMRCSTTQTDRLRQVASSNSGSAMGASAWLPSSSISTLHSRPSESHSRPSESIVSSVPLRFHSQDNGPLGSSTTNASPTKQALKQPIGKQTVGIEAKCGPWFGYCPENKPLFSQPVVGSQPAVGSQPVGSQPIESASRVPVPMSR